MYRAMLRIVAGLALSGLLLTARAQADFDAEAWFADDVEARTAAVNEGELTFLPEPPQRPVFASRNWLTLVPDSLVDGWVELVQCYEQLDAVPATEIVYRYREMRDLQVSRYDRIGTVRVSGNRIELNDVGRGASLCASAQIRILQATGPDRWQLRNGPFHRRFLDGYYPMRVDLSVRFPAELLEVVQASPAAQPGVETRQTDDAFQMTVRFAGRLTVELVFARRARH